MVIGRYPEMGIAKARARRNTLAAELGKNGTVAKAPLLKEVGEQWLAAQRPLWKSRHAKAVRESLEAEVWPELGETPIDRITARELLSVLRAVQARGVLELAHRLRQRVSSIFAFAIASGTATANPAAG